MEILKYTDTHHRYRARLKAWLRERVVPQIEACENAHITPKGMWEEMGTHGFLCPSLPREYGGPGLDFLHSVIVWEEMCRIGFTGLAAGLHSDIVVPYILSFGSEAQKQRHLPGCAAGTCITAVAMTEPGAGSDVAAMETTAEVSGDEIILNGSKTFISNGVNCDLVVLAARDPAVADRHQAVSLFLVEAGTPGFTKGSPFEKMGWKSQDTAELFFKDCRIPAENRLGEPGRGFAMLMEKLQQERLVCAVDGVANAETMLAQTRAALGEQSLSQAVRFALVEMTTAVAMARTFTDTVLADHMAGKQVIGETSMAKYWNTELAKTTASRCLDLLGMDRALESCPLVRQFRDVRVTSIFAGTNEIMKGIIAKTLGI